jgi:DNA-binding XRE family transcriptional regulator
MPLNEGNLAQNVRRLAGMHLASMEKLAAYIGVSRQTMQSIAAHDPALRSMPRADTVIKIAEAFAVSLNALYQEPIECLREALEHFEEAPIREVVDAPSVTLADMKRVTDEAGVPLKVHYLPKGRKRRE